jgi:hypothetical protein
MTMRNRYRLYYAPEGSGMGYCGEFETRLMAASAADRKPAALPEDLWDTARLAGHCGGQTAPPLDGAEDEQPLLWVGDYCVIKVRYLTGNARRDDNA